MSGFSNRHGYKGADAPITLREYAPEDLRYALHQIAKDLGLAPKEMRDVVCATLLVAPDPNNWSSSRVGEEIDQLLSACEWFKVYDVAEALHRWLGRDRRKEFTERLNQFFRERGIGWELTESGIVYRGGEAFTAATRESVTIITEAGRTRAANEIHEALADISRRPSADITGAIQHAIAALECTARDVTADSKGTLGNLIPRLGLTKPLDTAVEKLWGFASERARHLREGDSVYYAEAELVVSVACAVCIFLTKKNE